MISSNTEGEAVPRFKIGQLFKLPDSLQRKEGRPAIIRIWATSPANQCVGVVRCDFEQMPYAMAVTELEMLVESGAYIPTTDNPADCGLRCLEDIKDDANRNEFAVVMAANIELLKPVTRLGVDACNPKDRTKAIKAAIEKATKEGNRRTKVWVKKLFWRWCVGGPLNVGPAYHRCGNITREERGARLERGQKVKNKTKRPGATPPFILGHRQGTGYDRGGCAIGWKEEVLIRDLIQKVIDNPELSQTIAVSLRTRRAMPWGAIRRKVFEELQKLPGYKDCNPSTDQIRYIGAKLPVIIRALELAYGPRYAAANVRPIHGDYRDVCSYAGERYEVDPYYTDIILVDDVHKFVIGRVYVIFVIDAYSGAYVGAYVTTEEPTYAHHARALHMAFSPKKQWFKETVDYDIEEDDLPVSGRCAVIAVDNAQMLTEAAKHIPELVSDVSYCRPYRPDDKPHVESAIHLTNIGYVHFYPWGVTKGPKQPSEQNAAKEARISVRTFTRELYRWMVEVANHKPLPKTRAIDPAFWTTPGPDGEDPSQRLPTRINVYKWSARLLGGPPCAYDLTWMPRLLEHFDATVTEQGIAVEGVYFDDPKRDDLTRLKALAAASQPSNLRVCIDRLSTSYIYQLPDDPAGTPMRIPLAHVSRDVAGLTFAEAAKKAQFRDALTKLAADKLLKKQSTQQTAMKTAAQADNQAIKDLHGSIDNRNAAQNNADMAAVRQAQAAADNARDSNAIHGAPPVSPEAPEAQKPKPNLPSFYA